MHTLHITPTDDKPIVTYNLPIEDRTDGGMFKLRAPMLFAFGWSNRSMKGAHRRLQSDITGTIWLHMVRGSLDTVLGCWGWRKVADWQYEHD